MHYLEGPFDSALGKISHYLVPEHLYKSVHDYFNPHLFHAALIAILPNIPSLGPHLDSLLSMATLQEADNLGSNAGFVEVRIKNFTSIWNCMESALSSQGHQVPALSKQKLFGMVKDYDVDYLQQFLQHLFELLILHHGAVQHITELQSSDQAAIKDFLQRAKDKAEHFRVSSTAKEQEQDELKRLEQQNSELRLIVNSKEADLQRLSIHIEELTEQIQEFKELQSLKQAEIDSLKKRLLAYQETDTLFQQKDEQIQKLHKALSQLQMSNRLLTSDMASQKAKQQSRISDLEHSHTEMATRLQKLNSSFDLVSKQKEEVQISNKKVISNLKDKIKHQSQRISELQNQLVETKISRELREREFSELWSNYESLRSQSENQSLGRIEHTMARVPSVGELDRGIITASGHHRQFLRLGEEINELDKLQDNAFEEQIMMFESSEDNLKKVQEIINENAKLKQRLSSLESKGGSQDTEKLKKKLAVMKKRNEQLETQRREELDLMVSAFEHCLRSRQEQ